VIDQRHVAARHADIGDALILVGDGRGPVLRVDEDGVLLQLTALTLQGGVADPQSAAHGSLDALDAGLEKLTTAQSVVGSRLAWIELTNDRRVDMGELRSGEEAEVGGTDIASTVAKLQQAMTVLEASQSSFARLAQLSLFDVLR